ncbi:MAG: hypothetical protein HDT13_07600, partial [Butyrivibrio sp.]|nr:hypothetical protein [Butyrivibrio sp.]
MKKSIFSKVAAAAVAGAMVLGMAVTAFAADAVATGSVDANANPGVDTVFIDTTDLSDDERASIASIECYFTIDSDYMNGGGGYNKDGATWTEFDKYEIQAAGDTTVTFPVESYALSEDGTDSLQIQFWWLNAKEDGAGSFSLNGIAVKDASGNVLKTIGTVPSGA